MALKRHQQAIALPQKVVARRMWSVASATIVERLPRVGHSRPLVHRHDDARVVVAPEAASSMDAPCCRRLLSCSPWSSRWVAWGSRDGVRRRRRSVDPGPVESPQMPAAAFSASVVRVVDGDTFLARVGGGPERARARHRRGHARDGEAGHAGALLRTAGVRVHQAPAAHRHAWSVPHTRPAATSTATAASCGTCGCRTGVSWSRCSRRAAPPAPTPIRRRPSTPHCSPNCRTGAGATQRTVGSALPGEVLRLGRERGGKTQ